MSRPISPAVWDRLLEDIRGLGWDRYVRVVRNDSGRRFPFLSFGVLAIPLPGRRALLLIPGGLTPVPEVAIRIYWKIVRQQSYWPEGSTVEGLTREEADYLDRLDYETSWLVG